MQRISNVIILLALLSAAVAKRGSDQEMLDSNMMKGKLNTSNEGQKCYCKEIDEKDKKDCQLFNTPGKDDDGNRFYVDNWWLENMNIDGHFCCKWVYGDKKLKWPSKLPSLLWTTAYEMKEVYNEPFEWHAPGGQVYKYPKLCGFMYESIRKSFTKSEDFSKLEKIKIPTSVESIEDQAFQGATKLKEIELLLPTKLTSIGKEAFKNSGLVTIDLKYAKKMKIIGEEAFSGSSELETITIPTSVTEIGKKAFYGAKKLKKIVLYRDSQLQFIGRDAFKNSGLETIDLQHAWSLKNISEGAFEGTGLQWLETLLKRSSTGELKVI